MLKMASLKKGKTEAGGLLRSQEPEERPFEAKGRETWSQGATGGDQSITVFSGGKHGPENIEAEKKRCKVVESKPISKQREKRGLDSDSGPRLGQPLVEMCQKKAGGHPSNTKEQKDAKKIGGSLDRDKKKRRGGIANIYIWGEKGILIQYG